MGVTSDVGIAVTNKIDKLMRETLKAVAHGEDAVQMLDSMYVGEKAGWKLYHHGHIKWYTDSDPAIKAVHDFLTSAVDEDLGGVPDPEKPGLSWGDCVSYIIMTPEHISTEGIEMHGNYEDPFCLGYVMQLSFDDPRTDDNTTTERETT